MGREPQDPRAQGSPEGHAVLYPLLPSYHLILQEPRQECTLTPQFAFGETMAHRGK